MKPVIKTVLSFIFLAAFTGAYCENKNIFSLIFSGGADWGGITKSKNIDAVTGASRMGGHGIVHTEIDIAGHFLETGIDYVFFSHDLIYKDPNKNLDGIRTFSKQMIALPVLYNFHLFKRESGNPYLVIGLGITAGFFPYQDIKDSGISTSYQIKNWWLGSSLQISFYPMEIADRFLLGSGLNFYRSFSQYYSDDYYHYGETGIYNFSINFKYKL